MPSGATRVRFSGTYAAVLLTLVIVAVFAFPLALFAFVMPQPWGYLWVALVLSGTLAVMNRARRISLVVTSNGVAVHNLWRSYRLPWESIGTVSTMGGSMLGEGPGEDTIAFLLRDGRHVQSQATFGSPTRHRPILREIEKYAAEWNIDMPKSDGTIAR